MVSAITPDMNSADTNSVERTKTQTQRIISRNQGAQYRSQLITIDFDALPAPTTPLPNPIPEVSSIRTTLATQGNAARKSSPDKTIMPLITTSLRPPPRPLANSLPSRPRSVTSPTSLGAPPSESLPPVPAILHSNDSPHISSTPTSPTSPISRPSRSPRQEASSPTSVSRSSMRSASVGRTGGSPKNRPIHRIPQAGDVSAEITAVKDKGRARLMAPRSEPSKVEQNELMRNMEEPQSKSTSSTTSERLSTSSYSTVSAEEDDSHRPASLFATRYYGIESSMRWREGVDPVEKRFMSTSGSWRCQDRFAIFFRPGDLIGPDQVVTKTFWSEAWPYPIETILYGTTGPFLPSPGNPVEMETERSVGHLSDYEGEHQITRSRLSGIRMSSSESQLKISASNPSSARGREPRYINSEGVQKIAKVTIAMPDVAINQMEMVKAPIRVELRIYILEAPLRIHANAFLLGKTVVGNTELFV
ncbi:hypothetical protein BGW38_000540 [Lunasporangiospora selenospora]|uniref:Uncharacterized protein n=1 Tax=Lunasporangiospora selenospora TaxID=979761 RepID=A0A9P6G2C6_9FUNG|nr:hypothetical protein BGW38_000540 [Lunasporangiospora selenospora]